MSNVDAKAIAQAARHTDIISESIESDIIGAKTKDAANYTLFEHLHSQATLKDLRELCRIMKGTTSCSKTIDFGKKLQSKLDKVTANDVMYLCIQDHGANLIYNLAHF